MNTPFVSISCITYNHESYIRQAIEGFLMQKTNFPVEILIHDDASTDNTANIIREYEKKYPDTIKPIYQTENQYSRKDGTIGRLQRGRAKGKYYAMCEGDDYWTDPNKLQKQVDFLENHPEYIFCCHRFKILDQNTGIFKREYAHAYYGDGNLEIDLSLYSKIWITQPLTTVVRTEILLKALEECKKYDNSRDVHTFYHLLKLGKGISLNEFMGVYRWHREGVAGLLSVEKKFINGYNTYKKMYILNGNDIYLRKKYFYNLIGTLRYGRIRSLRINFDLFKEGYLTYCGTKELFDLIISFVIPRFCFNFIVKGYLRYRFQ